MTYSLFCVSPCLRGRCFSAVSGFASPPCRLSSSEPFLRGGVAKLAAQLQIAAPAGLVDFARRKRLQNCAVGLGGMAAIAEGALCGQSIDLREALVDRVQAGRRGRSVSANVF